MRKSWHLQRWMRYKSGSIFLWCGQPVRWQKGKPAPDVYLKVAEDLQVDPRECLVFEDVPKGIEAGKKVGMTVCAVEDACSVSDEVEKREKADYFIRSYDEIKAKTYERCGV